MVDSQWSIVDGDSCKVRMTTAHKSETSFESENWNFELV